MCTRSSGSRTFNFQYFSRSILNAVFLISCHDNDYLSGKSDLAKGLEELDDISARHDLTTPKSMTSDHACSAVLSPPPTLPSTPTGSGSMLLQTPIPLHETPVIPIISDRPSPSPEVVSSPACRVSYDFYNWLAILY